MIELHNVSLSFGAKQVLHSVNLSLKEQRIGITGCNGGGKSTFVRLLNALLLPTSGQVLINGLDTRRETKQVRRQVGFVFQNPDNQIVMPTVQEDLCFGMKNMGLSKDVIQSLCQRTLEEYGLWALRDMPAYHLSGGQKQLLAIAGVQVMSPELIVFDEPTTLLDLRNKLKIQRLLASLEQPIVVVSHDLDWLQEFDRLLVIDEGVIKLDGRPSEVIPEYRRLMQAC